MGNRFLNIGDRQALGALIDSSRDQSVVVFKHSTSCPMSAAAYREMESFEGDVGLVVVQTARDVSLELAAITGVRHESPQVLILRNGAAIWNASHYRIRARDVAKALEAED